MDTNSNTGSKLTINVGKAERIASILAGTLLVYKGFKNQDSKMCLPLVLTGGALLFRGATGHSEIYKAAGKPKLPDTVRNLNIVTHISVNKPRPEVYHFWRKLGNLPLFMEHLERVDETDNNQSHWVAKIPGGLGTIEWDAEIVKEEEGEFIGWNSLPHASINNAGKVEFRDADNGEGTAITVVISYRAPFGDIGEGVATLLNPLTKKLIESDIKNFKRYIEAGDLPVRQVKD